jgi:steroid delta-isomerase-like uncharacterized protein
MKNETQQLIERYYQAFNQADMPTFFSLLDEDIVHDINQGKAEIGKAAFEKFMQHMNHCYKERVVDLVVMVNDAGSRAAAEFVIEGEYLVKDGGLPDAHGQKYRTPCGAFFEVKHGKITRVTNYYNLQDWLKQVR